ncbi:MAG TPA: hypothetical protein VJT73_10195, partial [Polyangiaceae bacterium]|nr:hypothetical protein [Polyangiaceae bacterium]
PGCTEKLAAISGVTFFQAPPVNPNARVLGAPTTCTVNNTPAGYKCRIDRLVNQEYNRLDALVRSLSIPLPVARAFTPPVKLDGQLQPPSGTSTFDEFSGGALQGAMLDLLHALEAPRPILATLKTAAQRAYDGMDRAVAVVDQAIAQTNAAVAQENYLTQSEALKCDPQDLMDAMYFSRPIELVPVVPGAHAPAAKCISDPANYTSDYCVADDSGFDLVVTDDCCYAKVHNDPGHGTIAYKEDNDQLLNAGAWKALITECQVLRDQIKKGGAADTQTIATAAQKKVADIGVLVEQADALNAVQTLSIQLDEARAAIRTKYVALQKLMNDSRAAVARAETERKLNDDLAAATPFGQYSNGTYRLYRNHELWRAKATVDHARRYALAARRAIEARYVVDLSSLSEDEAFVASPRTWADEIYSYDLSLPAALGLSTSVGQSGTAYSSKVKDYVNNLKAFVAGYAARRPLAVATNEVDVITLPGLAPESAAFVNLAPAAATAGGASQSATLGGAVASRAADGNTSGVLANNSVSQTGQVPGVASWWNLDLQDYKWIDNITLWNRLDIVDSTQTLPLLVLVSDEPITAQFYFQALSSPGATWYLANLDGSFALPIKVSVGRWGRYVRVLPAVSFFSNLSLAEVQVWGYAPDNVALGRATTQSSTLRAASEAVDGFKGPIETGVPPQGPVSYASTNADVGTWWQVDLGTQRQIDRIELYHARALNVDSPAGVLHVLIADEPIVERGLQAIVARSDVSDTVIDVNAVSQTPAHVLPGRKGRYVRIWSTSGRILLGEVEVLSRPVQYPGWMLHCTDAGDGKPGWVPLSQRCEKAGAVSRADRAKLEFALDPWGRLEGSISQEPFRRRHNVRWGPLAVNIVGTGVRDCAKATDSKGCFAQGFIPFGLSHVGTPWITDYNGIWRSANMPEGRIEGGKALAAELWLDPLKDGWATSYIAPVARSEWEHRPLGGAYEISLDISPDVVIDRIDRVQLLVGSSSWVKQQ